MGLSRNISTRCVQEGKFLVWNAMIILISLLFLGYTQTELNIVKTPSPIKALLGKNVTLPCVLTRDNNQERDLDLSIVGIRWKKISSNESEIDVYRFLNRNHIQDRPGSFIDERELRRGNASLTLHHVQRSDEGKYSCKFFVTPNHALSKMIVIVLAQPDVTLSTTELVVEHGGEKSITCEVNKYYPDVVKIRWLKYPKNSDNSLSLNKATYFTVPEENSDGTLNVTSLLTVRPSSLEENGDSYSCIVTHESFNRDQDVRFTLIVTEPPKSHLPEILIWIAVSIFAGIIVTALFFYFRKLSPKISIIAGIDDLFHEKSSNLSWMVSEFNPRKIKIRAYLENGNQRQEISCWKYPLPKAQNSDTVDYANRREGIGLLNQGNEIKPLSLKGSVFSYNCFCSISITPDKIKDKGAELVIEVKHAALKTLLTKRRKLNIKGDLFTAQITAPQCLKHGKEVTLTCDITKCDPKPLSITWLKGEHVIYKDGKIQGTRYTHTETRDEPHGGNVLKSSSFLTFTAKVKEDHGVKYTCKVVYSAIRTFLKPCYELSITAQPVVEQITSEHIGQQIKLSCRVHSFHPKTIENKWFKEEYKLTTTDSELDIDEDGLYSTTSILMYVPEIEDIGKTLRCQVDHQSLPNPETREWKYEEQRSNCIKS